MTKHKKGSQASHHHSRKRHRKPRGRDLRRPAGLAPGTLVGTENAADVEIRVMAYGPDHLHEHDPVLPEDLPALLGRSPVTWVDIVGLGNAERLRWIGDLFALHALALEDINNMNQRPKAEAYGDDLLLFFRMTEETAQLDHGLVSEQIGLLLRPGLVVTFQEHPEDPFEPVRKRLRTGLGRLRGWGADYLTYTLLDAVVDRYVLLLDDYEQSVEDIEDRLLEAPSDHELETLHLIRRDLIALRRIALPLREVLLSILRETAEFSQFTADTLLFLRDCQDHAERAVEQIDATRELATSLMEVYLSTVSHRTNEAMKTLTVIATLFIPLSFIAGLYGMNFDTSSPWNMPELSWQYGYPAMLLFMAVVVVILLGYLKRKGF